MRVMPEAAARTAAHPRAHLRSVAWFGVVGIAATLVHLGVVSALVRAAGWAPLPANALAWFVAFAVSFIGHRTRSFPDSDLPRAVALRRFFAVAALGFVANQAAYAALLRFTPIRYDVAVVIVSLGVAAGTYVLSRFWAFGRAGHGQRAQLAAQARTQGPARPTQSPTQRPAQTLRATARRGLPAQLLLAVHVLGALWLAFDGVRTPYPNWDIIPYAALVHRADSGDPAEISRRAYADVRAYLGPQAYATLEVEQGPDEHYRRTVREQPAALLDILRFYEIKPLFLLAARAAHAWTGNAAQACVLVSALAVGATVAVLPFFFGHAIAVAALLWAGLLLGPLPLAMLAHVATPDALAMLFTTGLALSLWKGWHWSLAAACGALAVFARPDAVILAVPLLLGAAWVGRRGAGRWALLACAVACAAIFVALGRSALPWSTLFANTFVQRLPFPSQGMHPVTPAAYLAVFWNNLHVLLTPRPLAVAALAAVLAWPWRRPRAIGMVQLMAAAALANIAGHYLIFPIAEFGHERIYIGSYALVLVALGAWLDTRTAAPVAQS